MSELTARANALLGLLDHGLGKSEWSAVSEAVLNCGEELVTIGETSMAVALVSRVSQFVPPADQYLQFRLGLIKARALRISGRLQESLAHVRELEAQFASLLDMHPRERKAAKILEASSLWRLNLVDEATSLLANVRAALLNEPESTLLAQCAFELSSALLASGRHVEARASALEALVSSRRVGSRLFEALALENLHRLDRSACRWFAAAESGRAALEIFEEGRNRVHAAITRIALGIVEWKAGRLASATKHGTDAHLACTELGSAVSAMAARLLVALIHLHRGECAEASKCLHEAGPLGPSESDSRMPLLRLEYLGDVHLEQGQAEEALRYYDEAWPKALALVPKGDVVAELRRRRAECFVVLGRTSEARDEALATLKHCRDLGDRYEEAATFRILALSSAGLGKCAEAKAWFDQGFAMYEDIETPYEWGKLWLAYGDWLSGSHAGTYANRDGALEAYGIAVEHFERMGAEAKRSEVLSRIAVVAPVEIADTALPEVVSANTAYKRPARRPRMQSELERRSAWARETFGLITRSRVVLDQLDECSKLAITNSPILILGESGSGKELIATGVHKLSARRGPYMPLNCAAIPREVFESELFGHMAGSFTGAIRDKLGIFEACDGGTVFLDEIAEMPTELQARLLRFLESGEFRRIGSTRNTNADTRMVSATNRHRASLRNGDGFRPDLYYRLAHGVVSLPPLRQRNEDIPMLIDFFLEQNCSELRRQVVLSAAAIDRLRAHSWPGNVRELRAAIRRAVLFATPGRPVTAEELSLDESDAPTNLAEETVQVERRRIEEALHQANGVKSDAARALGLSRTTLISKMKRYGLMD